MTSSIAQLLARATELENLSDSARLDTELLLADALQQSRTYLYTWPERLLTAEQQVLFEAKFARRLEGEPVAYILGYQDFWSLRLQVSPATLIPRPETELLVEQALSLLDEGRARVADLGTGTGAIALALATERPSWQLVAVDLQPAAVTLAETNRRQLGLPNVEVMAGSWCQTLAEDDFDLIVSNPPYIDPEDHHLDEGDVRYEPRSALVSEQSGLADIQAIAEQAQRCLKPGGWLLFEHGYEQGAAVRALLQQQGYKDIQTLQDLAGLDRVTQARWP